MAKITPKVNKVCIDCEKLISQKSKYCKKCYITNHNPSKNYASVIKMAHHKENHPLWKGGKPICIDCGSQLSRYSTKRCLSCAKKGKLHPNYKDGKSFEPYSSSFTEELKEKIRKRDNYTCQNCSITEEEHIIVFGNVLTVHHIDYDKKNSKEDNLVSVCCSCNFRANYNRNYWRKYFEGKVNVCKNNS